MNWIYAMFMVFFLSSLTRVNSMESADFQFAIPETYDFEKSSEANYASPDTPFVGKFKHFRAQLDYSYHKRYCVERQLLQDLLIDRFLKTRMVDHQQNVVCEVPLENWIVFTAGPMGAGKGHTMQWLHQSGLFPMDAFVNVDPDALRMLLPETARYNHLDDKKMGYLTQKEAGYISEVIFSCWRKKNRKNAFSKLYIFFHIPAHVTTDIELRLAGKREKCASRRNPTQYRLALKILPRTAQQVFDP